MARCACGSDESASCGVAVRTRWVFAVISLTQGAKRCRSVRFAPTRLAQCESEIARLTRLVRVTTTVSVVAIVVVVGGFAAPHSTAHAISADSLRVHEITVVDGRGTVRARIGGDLPDAVNRVGRRIPRGDNASGLLIYDNLGIERGGYVTFDNSGVAALTLDSRGPQVAIFAADSTPGSGGALRIWNSRAWAELKVDEGGPHVSAARDNQIEFFEPPATALEQGAFCSELKGEVAKVPKQPSYDEVLAACRAHQSEKVCVLCLGKP